MNDDIRMLKEQIKNKDFNSAYKLAEIYDKKEEYGKGFHYLCLAAKNGNAEANYCLGIRYKEGKIEPQDYKKAFDYFIISGDLGYIKARVEIGYFYEMGILVKKSYEKALEIYEKYSEISFDAQLSIGRFYEEGIIFDRDVKMAEECYQNAVRLDNKNLSARLALRLLKPEGIKLEIAEQERLIEDEKKLKEKYLISTIIFFIITLTIVGGLITFMPFIDRLGRYSKSSKKIKNIEEKINKLNIKLMTIRNKNT